MAITCYRVQLEVTIGLASDSCCQQGTGDTTSCRQPSPSPSPHLVFEEEHDEGVQLLAQLGQAGLDALHALPQVARPPAGCAQGSRGSQGELQNVVR